MEQSRWSTIARNDDVDVVGPDLQRVEGPLSMLAHSADRAVDNESAMRAQLDGGVLQKRLLVLLPAAIGGQQRRTGLVVQIVYRAASIAVEPCAVGAEGEENPRGQPTDAGYLLGFVL